jgi:hypothetical protein
MTKKSNHLPGPSDLIRWSIYFADGYPGHPPSRVQASPGTPEKTAANTACFEALLQKPPQHEVGGRIRHKSPHPEVLALASLEGGLKPAAISDSLKIKGEDKMIIRWVGSIFGAIVLTFATFLMMPQLLRIDDPGAVEEFHRLYAFYNPPRERALFWIPYVCEDCNFDGITVSETATILEEWNFVAAAYRRSDGGITSPNCFSQNQRFLPHEIRMPQHYWIIIFVDQSHNIQWRTDDPFRNCEGYWGCHTSVDRRAAEELVTCFTGTYELQPGEHRLTVSLSDRQTA